MDKKQIIKEFEDMKDKAEIKALSKKSLEEPLSDNEYERMMELKDKIFE